MIIFLILIETICCDSSFELSYQDGSDEGSHHIFYADLTKIIPNYHAELFSSKSIFLESHCPFS